MKYTHILWDFNGTILDDVRAGIKSVNKLLSDRGLRTLGGVEEYRAVFGFPVIEYYRRLGFDFEREPYEVIAPLWVEQYLMNVKESEIFGDVKRTADTFREMGLKQIILSATELGMLRRQIEELGLSGTFDDILGLDNIHASSKVSLAVDWKSENPKALPLIIGDTVHDAEVADAIGADCVLVARGHQSAETLGVCGCRVYNNLEEILTEVFG